jgi:hypothetical protein
MRPLALVAAVLEAVLTEPPSPSVLAALSLARDAVQNDEATAAARDLVRAFRSDPSPSSQLALHLLSAALAQPNDEVSRGCESR